MQGKHHTGDIPLHKFSKNNQEDSGLRTSEGSHTYGSSAFSLTNPTIRMKKETLAFPHFTQPRFLSILPISSFLHFSPKFPFSLFFTTSLLFSFILSSYIKYAVVLWLGSGPQSYKETMIFSIRSYTKASHLSSHFSFTHNKCHEIPSTYTRRNWGSKRWRLNSSPVDTGSINSRCQQRIGRSFSVFKSWGLWLLF